MNENDFFKKLLKETAIAFESAPIKGQQKTKKESWNYAVCETPILRNASIILGLNWGGKNIEAQTDYPKIKTDRTWNFVNNSKKYLEEYLNIKNINKTNYSNLCFFRSPKIKYLKWKDWELSLPLFKKYVEYINPPWLLMFGNSGIPILKHFNHLSNLNRVEAKGITRRSFGYRGILFDKFQFYSVPHPQARISTESRNDIWKQLFTQI